MPTVVDMQCMFLYLHLTSINVSIFQAHLMCQMLKLVASCTCLIISVIKTSSRLHKVIIWNQSLFLIYFFEFENIFFISSYPHNLSLLQIPTTGGLRLMPFSQRLPRRSFSLPHPVPPSSWKYGSSKSSSQDNLPEGSITRQDYKNTNTHTHLLVSLPNPSLMFKIKSHHSKYSDHYLQQMPSQIATLLIWPTCSVD